MEKIQQLSTRELHSFVYYVGLAPKNNYLIARRQLNFNSKNHWQGSANLAWTALKEEEYLLAFGKKRLIVKRNHSLLGLGAFDKRKFITHFFWQDLQQVSLEDTPEEYWLSFLANDETFYFRIVKDDDNLDSLKLLQNCSKKFCPKK
ncbi:hypothetical protein [Enterococcus sp. LJL90]